MIQQSPWRVVCEAFLTHVLRSFDEIYQQWNSLLQAFLDDLLSDALPDDWRERLDQFLAQTEALGLEMPPGSIRALEDLIESHARGADKQVIDNPAERVANRIADQEEVIEPSRPPVIAGLPTPGHRSGQSHNFNAQPLFDERLKSARRHFTVMSQLLEVLGEKLDAAKPGEEVDVDYEVGRIIEHLRLYNDDLEAARYLWLRFQMPEEALARLRGMLTPIALGLPQFFDEAQAARERKQTADIGSKLNRRTGDLDSQISTLQTIDKVGTAAGFLAGGGTLVNIAKKGGKFVVLKTIAAIATAGAGYVADQWIESKLRERGVSDQTLRGVRLAAAVVSFILLRRASRRAEAKPGGGAGGVEERGVWDKGPAVRGQIIEKQLGQNLPDSFPTVDKFDKGIATSIKSLDLRTPTYANPQAILRVGTGYINRVASFGGGRRAGRRIRPNEITGRALDLAVPAGATKEQLATLQQLVEYGKTMGVTVNIVVVQ